MTAFRVTRERIAAGRDAASRVMGGAQARAVAGTAGVNVAIILVGSVGGLFLARFLGPTQRGELVPILQWPATIGTIVSLGVTQSACYWISRRADRARVFMSTAVASSLATGLVVAVLGPWIAGIIARNSEVARDLTLVLALTPAYIAGGVWISALQATSIRSWNFARAIQPLVYFVAVLSLWTFSRLTLPSVVAAFALSLIAQTAYSLAVARRVVGRHVRPDFSLLAPLYAYGAKLSLSSVPQLVNVNVDQLVLSIVPSVAAAQLGNYAVAASLSWLSLPASVAFGSVAFPRVTRAKSEGQARHIERLSLVGAGLTAGISIALICVIAPILVPRLFGSGYKDAIVPLWLLAPGTVFLALNRVLGDLLQGRGRPLLLSVGHGIGAVITVILLLILIPAFGIRGAAIASTVAYAAVFFFLILALKRVRLTGPLAVS